MNFEDLMTYLDLEDATEFVYFEAMADLIECEEYIEMEALDRLFQDADPEMIANLIDEYFEDVQNAMPDDCGELYTLLDEIKLCLEGLITNAQSESDVRLFTSEFFRFRGWYSEESEVDVISADGECDTKCIRDAITDARMEKLGGEKKEYVFDKALDYQLDSYIMSFAELLSNEEYEDNGDGEQ